MMPPMFDPQTLGADPRTVLLVDDDPAVLNALRFSLETDGFTVAAYGDGGAALAAQDAPGYAYAVLDYNMPGLSGLELLSCLRAQGLAAPAVLMTSNPSRDLRARVLAAGAELLEKPLLGDIVNERVRAALSH